LAIHDLHQVDTHQKKGALLPDLSETLVEVERPVLGLDELWSFVLKKARKRWLWLALCRQTRQGLSCHPGMTASPRANA